MIIKGKGKIVPVLFTDHNALKEYGGGDTAKRILDLGTRSW
jgi:hypothetical protein